MSTNDPSKISPEQLRELHLNALQSLYNLDDQTIGAVEVILAVELAHWDISNTADLMHLHDFIRARKPGLHAHFDIGAEALSMIKALEEHNGAIAEKLAATQKELEALRPTYANLSDILLETERERDQLRANNTSLTESCQNMDRQRTAAQRELATARDEIARLQATIDELNARRRESILAAIDKQEAGTAAAVNPPEATPALLAQTHTQQLISPPYLPHGAALAALERQANGNGAAQPQPPAAPSEAAQEATQEAAEGEITFDWTRLPMVYQSLITPLQCKEISWKSLSAEQKTSLAVEAAAQILAAQPDFPDTTLTHDLFNDHKPEWMTSLQGLAVGVPLPITELRTLAVNRAQRHAIRNNYKDGKEDSASSSAS